jgi:hypothetical protein
MHRSAVSFISGLLLGLGLVVSAMISPAKVLAFLDIAGEWDPSLAFVMAGAVAVSAIGFRVGAARNAPLFAPEFGGPTRRAVDRPLVLGAALFGVGWGLAGFCPGPAVAGLALGRYEPAVFVAAMLCGMVGYRIYARVAARRQARPLEA